MCGVIHIARNDPKKTYKIKILYILYKEAKEIETQC